MQIEPFGVEQWMNKWETRCELNLAETCVHSLTIEELLSLAGRTDTMPEQLGALWMGYGDITGSPRLRGLIAGLYDAQGADNVLVAHGTIGANRLVYETLVAPGDRVVSITPTYQQHTAIPRSLGADVAELVLQPGSLYVPDLDRLAELVTPGTRLIALTNPNNPTGALMERDTLERIAGIARAAGAWVLCDEVYRGSEQGTDTPTASMADLYEKGISTGGMSKVFSLAGLRLGWITGPESLLREVEVHRDYSTISVGRIDDYFAAMALDHAPALLARARRLTRENLAILSDWVAAEPHLAMVRPAAGTTALVHYDMPEPSYTFCEELLGASGVLLTPGSVMGVESALRIGYACETQTLRAGLARISKFLAQR